MVLSFPLLANMGQTRERTDQQAEWVAQVTTGGIWAAFLETSSARQIVSLVSCSPLGSMSTFRFVVHSMTLFLPILIPISSIDCTQDCSWNQGILLVFLVNHQHELHATIRTLLSHRFPSKEDPAFFYHAKAHSRPLLVMLTLPAAAATLPKIP